MVVDRNGNPYLEMDAKQRTDLTHAAYDIKEKIEVLTEELERILSKLIHGEFDKS